LLALDMRHCLLL